MSSQNNGLNGEKRVQLTPAFKDKEVINFFDDNGEDLSMLKDIISHRSNLNKQTAGDETNRLLD